MLNDQRSPYVGRFACGWHRLPEERPPGNHRPRREPGASISSWQRRRDRARGDQHDDLACARRSQSAGARAGCRAGGEHVVHQVHTRWRPADGAERRRHGGPPFRASPSRLRWRVDRSLQQRSHRHGCSAAERVRQDPGLVEPALGEPPPGEWHPRDHAIERRRDGEHRLRERPGHRPPPPELQSVYGLPRACSEQEGRPRHVDLGGRAVRAPGEVPLGREAAPAAPRFGQRDELRTATVAEWPRSAAAPGAGIGEHDVEQALHNVATLPRAADRPTAGEPRARSPSHGSVPARRSGGCCGFEAAGTPPPCPGRSSPRSRCPGRGGARHRRSAVP
jgi:hypothetical protein